MTKKLLGTVVIVVMVLFAAAPLALAQGFDGDQVVVNENFELSAGETLDGNLVVLRGNAVLEENSLVRGDVTVVGGTLDAAGEVRGNLGLFGGQLRLRSTAVVAGDLAAFGGAVTREDGAVVRGDTFDGIQGPEWREYRDFRSGGDGPVQRARSGFESFIRWQLGTVGLAILLSLLGVLLVLLAPRAMERLTTTISKQAALSFGIGLLTWILAVLAGAILLIACGLGLLLWLVLLAATILGWIAFALWLGWALLRALKVRTASSVAEVVLGAFIITFLTRIPWCGFLFSVIVGSIGLGAVVLTRFGTRDSDGTILPPSAPLTPRDPATRGPTFAELMEGDRTNPPPVSTGGVPESADEPEDPRLTASAPHLQGDDETAAPDTAAPPSAVGETLAAVRLSAIDGIDEQISERLAAVGILTLADLAAADVTHLAELTGVPVGQILLEDWTGQAQRLA
jgi:predicted flap endonuclease-1-like 5' DNA nuclease